MSGWVELAVFGGVMRDMVCNEIPRAFCDHQPYAVCSFAGGWVMIAAQYGGAPQWVSLVSAAATATLLRLLALHQNWSLPGWRA